MDIHKEPSSKVGYLQELCNRYGDFKIAWSFDSSQGMIWTKHRSVLECWHSDKGLWFLKNANHRNILNCEIVLDKDEGDNMLKWLLDTCSVLDSLSYPYRAYQTGSKGYHIHILTTELALCNRFNREQIREVVIDRFGCDLMKKSDSTMIAIEDNPHWKTGNMKLLIREKGSEENNVETDKEKNKQRSKSKLLSI